MQKDSVLEKIEIRKIVNHMRADEVSFIVKTDPLILLYGEDFLKKQKRAQARIRCANMMRELGRLLQEIRRRTNSDFSLFDIIDPQHFDLVTTSAKSVAGFCEEDKTYRGASTAVHLAARLKDVCDLLFKLIVKEDHTIVQKLPFIGKEEKLKLIKRFKGV